MRKFNEWFYKYAPEVLSIIWGATGIIASAALLLWVISIVIKQISVMGG